MLSPAVRPRTIVALFVVAMIAGAAALSAQMDTPIKGDAAVNHPAVQLAIKTAELIKAGRFDDAMAMRSNEQRVHWKAMSPADRRDMIAGLTKVTPDPAAFVAAVRKNGELSMMGKSGVLGFALPGGRGAAYFEREGATWRITNGPMVFPAQ